jgi:hypothetical protein
MQAGLVADGAVCARARWELGLAEDSPDQGGRVATAG